MNDEFRQRFNDAVRCLPKRLYEIVITLSEDIKAEAQELCLRTDKPLCLYIHRDICYIRQDGKITSACDDNTVTCYRSDIEEAFHQICHYSVYSKQAEIRNGFVTMTGGHRVGISGTAVYDGENRLTNIRDISSLNIRIAREVRGIAEPLLKTADLTKGGILLCGVPSSGKTTMLRDIARKLSYRMKVSVVDERGELSGMFNGICQNDMGMCDILNSYRKTDGILQAVRSMSPQVIVCDEVGTVRETECIAESLNSGVVIVASVHCRNKEEFLNKPQTLNLLHTNAFAYIVFLSDRHHAGTIQHICTREEMTCHESYRLSYAYPQYNADRILSFVGTQKESQAVSGTRHVQ